MVLKLMMLVDDPISAVEAEKAGVDRIFFDLEIINKRERQRGRNTVISENSIEDVSKIKKVLNKSELLVRVNPMHTNSFYEINKVISDGADIIMLPMVLDVEDVIEFVRFVDGRAKTILLLETSQSLARLEDILEVKGIDEIFIGLNDLHISLGLDFMFEVLSGGTVDYMTGLSKVKKIPFGFGGIARIGEGDLPSELIIGEHYRLSSSSVILSRTFKNKIDNKVTLKEEIDRIRKVESDLAGWTLEEFTQNQKEVKQKVKQIVKKIVGNRN
ncbi:aldolase/citrate lyase family protein [Sporosarcina sp. NPDC096371]|uniref:aldolase/citrate lyase family protein n=1 Tax=Sporosarcina sp. NPDC096371 TaxID=3364530 RepID=UPI003827BF55